MSNYVAVGTANQSSYILDPNEFSVTTNSLTKQQMLHASSSSGGIVNAKDFGAVGNGTTDDTTAIQKAINALTNGGIVGLPPGNYKITSQLNIGNGTSGNVWSTLYGIRLKGLCAGGGMEYGGPSISRVNLVTAFSSPQFAIKVCGPLLGWGIDDISISFGDTNASGIGVYEGISGQMNNVLIDGCANTAFTMSTYGHHNTAWNTINNLWIYLPSATSTATGVLLTGSGGNDSCFNSLNRLHITPSNAGHKAIILQFCDDNDIFGVDVNPEGASAMIFDYSVNNAMPNSNRIWGFEPYNNTITNNGSPGGGANNVIYGFSTGNGASIPALAKLTVL